MNKTRIIYRFLDTRIAHYSISGLIGLALLFGWLKLFASAICVTIANFFLIAAVYRFEIEKLNQWSADMNMFIHNRKLYKSIIYAAISVVIKNTRRTGTAQRMFDHALTNPDLIRREIRALGHDVITKEQEEETIKAYDKLVDELTFEGYIEAMAPRIVV